MRQSPAYDREVKTAGAEGSDAKERKIALALLKRYHESALVPIGMWRARALKRVQDTAERHASLDSPEDKTAAKSGKPSRVVLAVMSAIIVGTIALLVLRGGNNGDIETTPEADVTATLSSGITSMILTI